jgi:hypothetical protein
VTELRLAWEPINLSPLGSIETRFTAYMKGKKGATLLGNGTLLFILEKEDNEEEARKAVGEAKHLANFRVVRLREGGYLVGFNEAVAVYVGDEEFESVRNETQARLNELKFPEEEFLGVQDWPENHLLIGLYARGKLQRDIHNFCFHSRIRG